MNEVLDPARAERPYEGKYRYLADFSKQQHTSNLRVRYQDSFSKRSNSYQRRSSQHSANRRSSLKKVREGSIRHYSPSCSTFNPRREATQQEFSPYDQRAEKAQECLNKQLLEENAQLRSELIKSKQSVEGLIVELGKRDAQADKMKKAADADLQYFQKLAREMTDQIQVVLTKNKMLESELVIVKRQLQEEYIRQEEMLMFQEEHRRQQLRRRDQEARKREDRRFEDQRRPNPFHSSKRSVGKVMNRPNLHDSLGSSKIKIEEDTSYSGIENFKPSQGKVDKQSKKYQELINSIKSMQQKITGDQSSSLRQLWKWLKGVGHSHSCLKKWKSKILQNNTSNNEKWRQLVRQACGYIQ